MSRLLWRIRHPIKAYRYWRAMRGFEAMFGKFGPVHF